MLSGVQIRCILSDKRRAGHETARMGRSGPRGDLAPAAEALMAHKWRA